MTRKQFQEIKRIKDDPHTEWRKLSREAKEIIKDVNQEIERAIGTAKLSPEGLEKCIGIIMEQTAHIDVNQLGDAVDITDASKLKEWIDGIMRSVMKESKEKTNPFLALEGALPATMNKCGIGIESIATANYQAGHNRLRQIVKERTGSAASKAYKTYLAAHYSYYSFILLSKHLLLFYQHAETLSTELRDKLQGAESFFDLISITNSASLQEAQASLDIAESVLIESIAGWEKIANEPGYL